MKARIEINLKNLVYNFEKLRKNENVIPVVKANAYNIGVYEVVNTLFNLKKPQNKFFVFDIKEGIELRKLFPNLERIFVLEGIFEGDEKFYKKFNLTPVINNFEQLKLANENSINEIILQFNTGMNRSGIQLNELQPIKNYVEQNKIKILMIMSHFCCADDKNNSTNQKQINNFREVAKYFPDKNILRGLSASDGIVNFELKDLCDTCRPGLVLYGYYDNYKPICSIYSKIESDGANLFLPLGINNGFTSEYGNNQDNYIIFKGVKIYIKSISKDRVILDTNDRSLIGKEITIVGESISYKDFEQMCKTDIRDILARIISNCDKEPKEFLINTSRKRDLENETNYKISAKIKNNIFESLYSKIIEKREVEEDGIAGYGATQKVIKGDKLAIFPGGYLDGISRSIANKKCKVFIENKNKKLIECEIFGRISMDQTVIKIPNEEYKDIEIGAKVIIFDGNHSIERFEKATGKTREELFFYLNRSSRVELYSL